MKKNLKKGFTLIELLVVVAIIGILASVVLASLNTARSKGSDAAIKANLDNMRAEAAIYYDGTGNQAYGSTAFNGSITNATTYSSATTNLLGDQTFFNGVMAAASANGSSTATPSEFLNIITGTSPSYVAAATLKTLPNEWWCVDSSGASKLENSGNNSGTPAANSGVLPLGAATIAAATAVCP
jgi:prepilin-type N-terminal cleavage/methylation domain-containing protein